MQRQLISSGNGWALYMPKDVLKLLGYNPQSTYVLLTMEKNVLKISKINENEINPDFLIKKFNKNGNGYGIYITNSIIEFLEIDPETDKVKYEIVNGDLFISKYIDTNPKNS